MNKLMLAALLLAGLAAPALSCDVTAGPGKVIRYSEGSTGGMATVGCVFHEKYDVRLYWVGEQRLYDDQVRIDAYPAASVSRIWMFRDGKKFRPVLGMGLLVKGAQRCVYNGEVNCNRQLPLPFAFLPTIGFKWGDILLTLGHASNDSLDWGPEKKNLGLDFVRAEVWLR